MSHEQIEAELEKSFRRLEDLKGMQIVNADARKRSLSRLDDSYEKAVARDAELNNLRIRLESRIADLRIEHDTAVERKDLEKSLNAIGCK